MLVELFSLSVPLSLNSRHIQIKIDILINYITCNDIIRLLSKLNVSRDSRL